MFGRLVVWVLPHARLPEGMVTAYETCPRACAHRCHNRKYCFGGNLLCNLLRNLLRLRFGCAEGLRPKNLLSVICYTICYPLANQTICAEAASTVVLSRGGNRKEIKETHIGDFTFLQREFMRSIVLF